MSGGVMYVSVSTDEDSKKILATSEESDTDMSDLDIRLNRLAQITNQAAMDLGFTKVNTKVYRKLSTTN